MISSFTDSLGELAAIRASACELRSDFDQHQKKCNSYARPVSLNVAGVLDKVVDLAKSIDSLCLRDYSAYLQHVKELADGRKDESLATLNKLCSDAYKEIESRERMLNEILSSTKRAEEKLNDLVGSAERLERGVAPIKEALQVEMKEARVELQKAQEREKMMNDLARSAEESYKQAQAALDDKRRTNKNFFTGLGDWFSRKDVSTVVPRLMLLANNFKYCSDDV